MDSCGNRFWSGYRDQNSTPRNPAGARRRRIRLCRPIDVARHPAIQARLQHEISRNLRRVCRDHVNLRPNDCWNSFGIAPRQRCLNCADFFSRAAISKLHGWNRGRCELCGSFCKSIRVRLRWSRDALCNATGPWRGAAFASRIRSTTGEPLVCNRIALRSGASDEAARDFLHSVWSELSRFKRCSPRIQASGNLSAKSDI